MSKFNLTFSGEILAGADPSEVKERFGKMFGIEDTARLERFFSGQNITLRRNLSRKEAAQYYHQLHLLGAIAVLVKIDETETGKSDSESLQILAGKEDPSTVSQTQSKTADSTSSDAPGQVWATHSKGTKHRTQKNLSGAPDGTKGRDIDLSVRIKAHKAAARQQREARGKAKRTAEQKAKRKRLLAAEEQQRRLELTRRKAEDEEAQQLASELASIDAQKEREILEILAKAERKRTEAKTLSSDRLLAIGNKTLVQESLPLDGASDPGATDPSSTTQSLRSVHDTKADGSDKAISTPLARKIQTGEPNFYTLRPFRNNEKVRKRARKAQTIRRRGLQLGTAAMLLMLVSASQLFALYGEPPMEGPSAIATNSASELVLLVNNTLVIHDRSGILKTSITGAELGVHSLQPPLAFESSDTVLVMASPLNDSENIPPFLARCHIQKERCEALLEDLSVNHLLINPVDNSILLAGGGQLIKMDAQGQLQARADLALPRDAALQMHAGLLFVNSADGPAIRVYRYENSALGTQIDEILLIPPPAVESGRNQIAHFAWSANAWWVVLRNPDSGDQGMYRFDENWNFLDEIDTVTQPVKLDLINWGKKTLAYDFRGADIVRLNDMGKLETPFTSSGVAAILSSQEQRSQLARGAWLVGCLCATAALLVCTMMVFVNGLRQEVYKSCREKGADPIDDYALDLSWVDLTNNRSEVLQRWSLRYYLLALSAAIIAAAQNIDAGQMVALLLLLSGPGIALLLLRRSNPGNIGLLNDRLLLVDHRGIYHLAGGSRIQFKGHFLAIDDVIVFTGNRLLPAFNTQQISQSVMPLAARGVKVDSKIILVKLLEARHPIAMAVMAILASSVLTLMSLGLLTVFQS